MGSACLSLAACGGGGGGASAPQAPSAAITFSADQLSFSTTGPWDSVASPARVDLVGTVQGSVNGTLYVIVQVNNPELVSVSDLILTSETSGQVTVTAANPANLPPGVHTGSLVVRTCVNDPACNSNQLQGSPKTIPIVYRNPSNVDGDAVMPHVVTAGTAGTVIIRGSGFPAGATVSFGAVAASTVNVVSSTEIRATYPALSEGTHTVAINSGAVAFDGNVAAIVPADYAAVFLPHPVPLPAFVTSIDYDAERRALFVGLMTSTDLQIMRYAYSGSSWSSPTIISVSWLRQLRMTPDGSTLLVLRSILSPAVQTVIEERDPVTLAVKRSTVLPDLPSVGMAFTNDSQVLIPMSDQGFRRARVFGLHSRQFRALPFGVDGTPVASADGGRGIFMGSFGNFDYDPSTGKVRQVFGDTNFGFEGNVPAVDLTGAHTQTGQAVVNDQLALLGLAPNPNSGGEFGTASINRAGTRMYGAVPGPSVLPVLYTWDLTQAPIGGNFVQIGNPVDLPGDHGAISAPAPQMIVSPDGRTVFIGGWKGIAVMPAPAAQ